MVSPNNKLHLLLQWCTANSILIDSRIQLRMQDSVDGIGVFSLDSYIPPQTTLVRIPKDAIISVRTCSFDDHKPIVSYGLGAQLCLSLALMVEILKDRHSRWYGYLQSLPDGLVDLPVIWERTDMRDSRDAYDCAEALSWLNGTEAAKTASTKTETCLSILDEINNFFHDVAEPLLRSHSHVLIEGGEFQQPSLEGFYRAFSLVSSRAFLVDTYHGLSMVPIADAFNHVVENHVHLESDYLVCPDCGSVWECAHDWDEAHTTEPSFHPGHGQEKQDSCYEMVSNTGIAPHLEVFNTYGETLTNSQLLNQYGFILDVNENDCLEWSTQEVLTGAKGDSTDELDEAAVLTASHVFLHFLSNLPHAFDQSQLVCHDSEESRGLSLNGEGKISLGLWALLAAFSCCQISVVLDSEEDVEEIIEAQLLLEAILEEKEQAGAISRAHKIVPQIAQAVVNLCDIRRRNGGKPGSFALDLSDLLEKIPLSHRRTRVAISVLMAERSVLDACQAAWSTFFDL